MMRTVVLAGAGHTHSLLIAGLAGRRWPDVAVLCVHPSRTGTYSGMLPGVLAGQYTPEQMTYDVSALCRRGGVSLIEEELVAVDAERRIAMLSHGTRIPYDLLSLNLGSGAPDPVGGHGVPLVTIRPMATFLDRMATTWRHLNPAIHQRGPHIRIVGGGLGALELAFTLPGYLSRLTPGCRATVSLQTRSGDIAPHATAGTRARLRRLLQRRHIAVVSSPKRETGPAADIDLVVWAGGSTPPRVSRHLGVATTADGYVIVNETLQTSSPHVFAVGDTAAFPTGDGGWLPKAGVYAVRQAPVLAHNLRAALERRPPRRFVPQSSFLTLVNTGDGRAIGQWRGRSFEGVWAWWLKDAIDRRFVARF